jgi:hypothetical protein
MTMVASPGRSSNKTGTAASAVVSSNGSNHPPPKLQQQQQHPNILFIAIGFLLVANVCCFMLFAVLLDPEPEAPLVPRRNNSAEGTVTSHLCVL